MDLDSFSVKKLLSFYYEVEHGLTTNHAFKTQNGEFPSEHTWIFLKVFLISDFNLFLFFFKLCILLKPDWWNSITDNIASFSISTGFISTEKSDSKNTTPH